MPTESDLPTDASRAIDLLGLEPHPEGGYFRETWRHDPGDGERGAGTAIYYLLARGDRSHWHRVDAAETWHYYAGAALELSFGGVAHRLGPDLVAGERPQLTVPAGVWQSARSLGDYSLVGCTVSPAFRFSGFELAPPGWSPE